MVGTALSIKLKNIYKHYGKLTVLKNLSLEIDAGQMVVVVGPSGCGKSTLLRLLAGFSRPDSGQILFNDQPIDHLPPEKRPTALVFQNYALWPHKTVFDNVAFGLWVRHYQKAAIQQRVEEMLKLVQLEGLEKRYPGQLSGGQQQRVALARSLAISPGILLLDEPLSNLDPQIRLQMQEELRALQQRLGLTTIYVTHDQAEALALADQLVVMKAGEIEQAASPLQVYQHPASLFVAEFIGRSNRLSGTINALEGQALKVELQSQSNPAIKVDTAFILRVNATNWRSKILPQVALPVVLTIKPEQIKVLCSPEELPTAEILRGRVLERIFEGVRWRLKVETAFGMLITETAKEAPLVNELVNLILSVDHLNLFPTDY